MDDNELKVNIKIFKHNNIRSIVVKDAIITMPEEIKEKVSNLVDKHLVDNKKDVSL